MLNKAGLTTRHLTSVLIMKTIVFIVIYDQNGMPSITRGILQPFTESPELWARGFRAEARRINVDATAYTHLYDAENDLGFSSWISGDSNPAVVLDVLLGESMDFQAVSSN